MGVVTFGVATLSVGMYHYQPTELVWDLDHTLAHARKAPLPPIKIWRPNPFTSELEIITIERKPAFMIQSESNPDSPYYVYPRPGALKLVQFFSWFTPHQYVFTAAKRNYADQMIEGLGLTPYLTKSIAREEVPIDEEKLQEKTSIKLDELSKNWKRRLMMHYFGKNTTLLAQTDRIVLIDDKESALQNNRGILAPAFHAGVSSSWDSLKLWYMVTKCFFID